MLIILSVINALAVVGWRLFYQNISGAKERIGVLRGEATTAEAKQKNIRNLTKTLEDISDKKSEVDSVFVDEKSVVKFIEDLERLAKLSGVSLQILSASLPVNAAEGKPGFNLNLGGQFGGLFKFLALLENMNYQLKVETANFQALGKKDWGLQVNLRLLSYIK